MIDDIKDLSLIQKQKKLKRRSLSSAFWKTFPLAFVASVGMSLFGIMITGCIKKMMLLSVNAQIV